MMRNILILFSFFILSCENKTHDTVAPGAEENDTIEYEADTAQSATATLFWEVDAENKTKRNIAPLNAPAVNADSIIQVLNELYPEIKLEKIKTSGDTVYTVIKESSYLAERMGSYGPAVYLAQAVINLTSLNGINYVKIDFTEGSHARPGVWSRHDYKDYKEIE
jgi:hypothetical protein